ncbi:MAG: histidine phosphatase family protein [Magnetococcales bacterium]|nr:histidine phosphatase family protein [Magnetococcales bacterium]NGZ26385.1 histidine phosphatase family protein [Magnetococcales bacterium]
MNPSHLPPPTFADLLRHGEPQGGERYRGSQDDPLSELGWQQMNQAVGNFNGWQVIITSPLIRCSHFAHQLAGRLSLPIVVEPRLREMSFGQWEGHSSQEILSYDGDRLRNFWRDPLNNPPPDGEHLEDLAKRVGEGFNTYMERYDGSHMLFVLHGGVIRTILALTLHLPLQHLSRLLVPYACLSRIRRDRFGNEEMPRLVFHGGSLP